MSLHPLVIVLALAPVLLAAPRAYAGPASDPLEGGVAKLELWVPDGNGDFRNPGTDERKKFLNLARCVCDANETPQQYQIRYTWSTPPNQTIDSSVSLEVFGGENCDAAMPADRATACSPLPTITDPNVIPENFVYRVRPLIMTPAETMQPGCVEDERAVEHWAAVATTAEWLEGQAFSTATIDADTTPPPVPGALTLRALEDGIKLEWSAITTGQGDIKVFQALCSREDGAPAYARAPVAREYETPFTVCGAARHIELDAAVLVNPIGESTGEPPLELQEARETHLCGQETGSATSITLRNLENDVGYRVVLVSVDETGNARGIYVDRPIVPREVVDFWEELNNENGNLRGGFCVSQVGADGALGSAVLVALAGLFAGRRRRGTRRAARLVALALVAVVLAPGLASAQATFSPYWLEEEPELGFSEPNWTLGVRVGPYRPSIDDSFSSNPGPYARTFKKDTLMVAADLHRVWSLLRGQVGVGFTAGYYGNSTNAFVQGSDPDDPDRPRAVGNTTSLRIVPLALTATYRATIFDDEMGIPLVPYARAGIAYDVWWIRAPTGELSSAMSCPTCNDRALGATLGVVGAIGLAIRAERIDPDAARSMRDSGFEHAGFFAEIELSKVDGFGDEKRLSVGDTTWFGGINFEF